MCKIKVAICDDMQYLTDYFSLVFSQRKEFEVVWVANSTDELDKLMKTNTPNVLLLDIQIETTTSGLDILPGLKKSYPKTKIIMLTVNEKSETIFQSICNGADNYILKTSNFERIIKIVKRTYENDIILEGTVAKKIVDICKKKNEDTNSLLFVLSSLSALSSRELDVLRMKSLGYKTNEIAKMLFVEPSTIRSHCNNILKKTKYKSMDTLIDACIEAHVFDHMS